MEDNIGIKYEREIEKKDINVDDMWLLTVVTDGCWPKRSYRTGYNALSGVAIIKLFGWMLKRSTVVLVIGSKTPPQAHICNKNVSGPSTAMEADIILGGSI